MGRVPQGHRKREIYIHNPPPPSSGAQPISTPPKPDAARDSMPAPRRVHPAIATKCRAGLLKISWEFPRFFSERIFLRNTRKNLSPAEMLCRIGSEGIFCEGVSQEDFAEVPFFERTPGNSPRRLISKPAEEKSGHLFLWRQIRGTSKPSKPFRDDPGCSASTPEGSRAFRVPLHRVRKLSIP